MDAATWGIIGLSLICLGLTWVLLLVFRENRVLSEKIFEMSGSLLREVTPHAPSGKPTEPLESWSVRPDGLTEDQRGNLFDGAGKPLEELLQEREQPGA